MPEHRRAAHGRRGGRPRPHARRVRARSSTSSGARPTRSSWRCSRCCGASTAPTSTPSCCCKTLPTEGRHVVMGPGENAGAVSRRRRPGRAPSRSSRTTTRARSSPSRAPPPASAGILRDIFALGARPDRRARLAALRRARRVGALALPARPRRGRHRALRQLDRRADDRRRGLLRGALRAELPGQRDGARPGRDGAHDPLGGRRRRQRRGPLRRLDGPRRHRRRVGAGQRRARRGRRRQAPVRPGRRPVRGEEAHGVLARAARPRPARRRCRTSARPG